MYDLIIKSGSIYDGDGGAPYIADIAIKNGKIIKIGTTIEAECKIIDAKGLAVTPGFIDSHSHSDRSVIAYPEMREKLEQGITTAVAGQCGSSFAPIALPYRDDPKYASRLTMSTLLCEADKIPQGMSTLTFVGHGSLRNAVIGMANRPATAEELEQMKALLRDALDAGAIGMSFGLLYSPGCYAEREELFELARVVGERGGLLSSHVRNESDDFIAATTEFIDTVKASGGAVGIHSHIKSAYKQNHGKVKEALRLIEEANREGYEIYCDVYPYVASHTSLSARFVHKDMRADGKLAENMASPEMRAKAREYIYSWCDPSSLDFSWIFVDYCPAYPEYQGKLLSEIAKIHGKDAIETGFDILRDAPNTACAYFSMCEEDVETAIRHPLAMFCTDSEVAANREIFHPRLRAAFPRVLARYVRERGVITLPEAIRKMTSLPAKVYRLASKGHIKEGYDADICIFSPEKILDNADFSSCKAKNDGLSYVIVGGEIAVVYGAITGIKNGKIIRAKS